MWVTSQFQGWLNTIGGKPFHSQSASFPRETRTHWLFILLQFFALDILQDWILVLDQTPDKFPDLFLLFKDITLSKAVLLCLKWLCMEFMFV